MHICPLLSRPLTILRLLIKNNKLLLFLVLVPDPLRLR